MSRPAFLVVLLLVAACGDHVERAPPPIGSEPAHLLARTQGETEIEATVSPLSSCRLQTDGVEGNGLLLSSDRDGIVRFTMRSDARQPPPVTLTCTPTGGSATRYPLVFDAVENLPARARRFIGATRPALAGDPMAYTPNQLRALRLPPRPDPTAQPERFAKWLGHVQTPTLLATTDHVTMPQTAAVSPIWNGYQVGDAPQPIVWIQADFTVPRIVDSGWASDGWKCFNIFPGQFPSDVCSINTDSVIWDGIHGTFGAGANVDNTPLMQAGTDQAWYGNTIYAHIGAGQQFHNEYTATWSWIEYFPDFQVSTPGFSAAAGDVLEVDIWAGDSAGNVDPNGGFAWFDLWNQTSGIELVDALAIPKAALPFAGRRAEWIMEKPTIVITSAFGSVSKYIAPLTHYGNTSLWLPYAMTLGGLSGDPFGVFQPQHFVGAGGQYYTMCPTRGKVCPSSGNPLESVAIGDPNNNTITFNWRSW